MFMYTFTLHLPSKPTLVALDIFQNRIYSLRFRPLLCHTIYIRKGEEEIVFIFKGN